MSIFGKLFKRGSSGLPPANESRILEIHGKPIRCLICSNSYFYISDVQLNTRTLTFLNLEWMNKSAVCATCDNCGHIHWFSPYVNGQQEK